MASIYSADNMVAANRAQIRQAAKVLGIHVDNGKSNAAVLALVKAR